MTENESIVNSLEANIKKLMLLLEQFRNKSLTLENENEILKETIKMKDAELKDLQGKHENLRFARLLVTGGEDSHEAKLKVNRIVREIDKCIALLNK